jgi:hypothetical protein
MKVPILAFVVAIALGAINSTATAETGGPLPPGKPAGVHQAQQDVDKLFWIVGAVGLIGFGIAIGMPTNGNTPTVSTTSTAAPP